MVTPHITSVTPDTGARRHPLLFVHGAWHGAWCWERFQGWFAERGWETHAVDLRGHGETPNDRSLRFTRIRHYVEDLGAAIETLDRPPILIAHSMGALVAQRHLERNDLPGAVLVAPVPIGGVWRATFRTLRRHPVEFLRANLTWSLGPLVKRRSTAQRMFLLADESDDEVDGLHARLQSESYLAYLDMLMVTRARPQLVHTPVRIVAAEQDALFSTREHERMAAAYGTDLTVVPDTAHDLMLGTRWESGAAAVAESVETIR